MKYVCKCGKVFENSQSLNAHKGWCKLYLGEERYNKNLESQKDHFKLGPAEYSKRSKEQKQQKEDAAQKLWESNSHYCEKCGKELPKDLKEVFGSGRFCSRSCANSRVQTADMNLSRSLKLKKSDTSFCKCCGNKVRSNNKSGYCIKCYYKNVPYSEERKDKQRVAMTGRSRWNIHRNQISYPEKFWMTVLENNSINYFHEYQILKNDGHTYYLDFLIRKGDLLIDLEIDGSQHKERVEKDTIRDNYLLNKGYIVYRVKWNSVNNVSGSVLMKEKIDDFIKFLSSL